MSHDHSLLFTLSFTESGEPLHATGLHPFYSLDRGRWVRAKDLRPDERLETLRGAVTLREVWNGNIGNWEPTKEVILNPDQAETRKTG